MKTATKKRGGYLVRVKRDGDTLILGPYATAAEAEAVKRDAMEQRKQGRL